nr:MarR family transcriptional regulator [Desulfofarcimen acetoxidans]
MNEQNFDLIEQFTRIEWLLHRYHQQNHMQYGPMGDPRRGQGRVLAILKMQPEISQKDLSYLLDMRPQSLGELLSKLERKGYITRTASETDRRVMNIKLTKEGAEATEQEFSFDKLFECLNEEEQMNLSIYLSRIIETIEAQLGDEQFEPGFDPRIRRGNPFDARFGRHHNWGGDRRFYSRDFNPCGGMQDGWPGNGEFEFDPRLVMGHNPGMMLLGRRPGMSRGRVE